MINFSKYITVPLTMLALAGCGPIIKEPKESDSDYVNYTASLIDRSYSTAGVELYIIDEDGDGIADLIERGGAVHWVAQGYTPKKFVIKEGFTETMTPEIQAAATRELQAEKDLAFLVHKENYRLQEQKKGEQK